MTQNINLANLNPTQGFSISGASNEGQSGYSVAGAGDINNDGIDDLIIGAPYANNYAGISYVIYGGTTLTSINLVDLTVSQGFSISGQLNSESGSSVAGAGDINNDGINDLIIGAPNGGISYVIYGSKSLTNIDLANINISQGFSISDVEGAGSGSSVAGVGDINNDGYDDVIIGAPFVDDEAAAGISYVIYGGTALTNINLANITYSQGFSISGVQASESGSSVAGAGDINNDGLNDLIIGAPNADIAYVIYGGTALTNINLDSINISQGFSISGLQNSENGYSVAGVGDINKDGIADIIIGAPYANSLQGISYVIYGGISLTNINLANITYTQGFSISGVQSSESGSSVAGAGDINNDGINDLIIGAPNANNRAGVAYVIYGGTGLTNINLANITYTQGFSISGVEESESGWSVAGAGDINNDGIDDVIIGAPFVDNDEAGIAYVIYGAAISIITNSPTLAPASPSQSQTIIPLSLLSNYQGISIYGSVSSYSGYSVSSAGDINNDGFDDFMIGSPYTNNYAGESYIIYGSSEPTSLINLVQIGTQGISLSGIQNSYSGDSVNSAGDINGDGNDDFAFCSPDVGTAYVVYGSNSISSVSLANFFSVQGFSIAGVKGSESGYSVSGAGDINNDGIADIVIGAPNANNDTGVAYIIYGDTGLTNINLASMTSSQGFYISGSQNSESGWSVSGAGDINNDGIDDIIIGAPFVDNDEAGIAYVIYGGTSLTNINLANISYTQGFYIDGVQSESGFSVSGAGDINNDGYDDIIIGAPNANNYAGVAYVIYGGTGLTNINLASITLSQGFYVSGVQNSESGWSVAGAGDVNNDGYGDIIIGAPYANNYASISYVIYGGTGLTNINLVSIAFKQGFSISGVQASESGWSVAGAGDINNDGIDDIIIGAPGANNFAGIAYVIYGGTTLTNISLSNITSSQGFSISGSSIEGNNGWSVAGAGDINNDGIDDIIIGAPLANMGISYVIYGGTTLTNINLGSVVSSQGFYISGVQYSESGWSVAGAGDINNDGIDDIIIGAPLANMGISYVIYGGTALTNINLANFPYQPKGFNVFELDASISGCIIAPAGDINGDSYDDIIIGNPSANDGNGLAYVIYGNANYLSNVNLSILNPKSGFAIVSTSLGSNLGNSVAGLGDINNDGYADIIIGAPFASNDAGISYILFGNATLVSPNLDNLSPAQGFIINGALDSQSGYSVAGAGDLNKDGYNDIIIGAPGINNGTGEVYIIYGKAQFNTIDLSTLTSSQGFNIEGISQSYCGYSVNGAGDVNNDTYPDLIIGAPYAYNNAGEAYVIYGSSSLGLSQISLTNLDSNQGFYVTSAQDYSQCGFSVAGAGDINNDGYDDIIIGAPNFVYDNSIAGAAFVVYGAASGFTTLSPTLSPSESPTASPPQVLTPWWDSIEFKVASTIGFSIFSFAAAWLLRNKVAVYVLDNWGHKYILYNPYVPLKENEVGLKFSLNNQLICIAKFKEYILLDIDHDSHGISKPLHNVIIQSIENSISSQSFDLLQAEQNQIRNYLIAHNYLNPTSTFFCLEGYRELGYTQGTIYNFFLKHFEAAHARASKKQARHNYNSQISGDEISTSNPVLTSESIDDKYLTDSQIGHAERKTDNSNLDNDIESPKRDSQIMEISRHGTKSLANKKSCVVMCIDSMMDPEHVRLQEEEFVRFGKNLQQAYLEISQGLSKSFHYAKDTTQKLLKSIDEKSNTLVLPEAQESNNPKFSFYSNDLIVPLLTSRQVIEYIPLVSYFGQNIIYPLLENHLPESAKNISLPKILDSKVFLFTAHLGLGFIGANLLPQETITKGLIGTVAASTAFGFRLASSHYLNGQKQEIALQQNSVDITEITKYCVSTIFAYTVPAIVTCTLAQSVIQGYNCAELDLVTKLSLAGAECYSVYKTTQVPIIPTTADLIMPYVVDGAVALSSYASGYSLFAIVASVFTTDWISRLVMDLVPDPAKESYVDPIFDYASEFYSYAYDNINQIVGVSNEL